MVSREMPGDFRPVVLVGLEAGFREGNNPGLVVGVRQIVEERAFVCVLGYQVLYIGGIKVYGPLGTLQGQGSASVTDWAGMVFWILFSFCSSSFDT